MRNLWSPASFQGGGKKRNYFEGWYFKHSGGIGEGVWSFIPGLALGDGQDTGYAFVQVIEGKTGGSWWFQYPAEEFHAAESGLDIQVGKNRFTDKGIEFDLDNGTSRISGAFTYGPFSIMRFPFWSPGVMGPFTFVPGMECNHGLVSLDHRVDGRVEADGRAISISDGRGYIEKDWGTSMPESWIWTQSNDFPVRGDSMMLSVAKIPWLGSSFRGFLCAFSHGGEKHLFTTYNGSKLEALSVTDDKVACTISCRGRFAGADLPAGESLEISVTRSRGGILRAPVAGLLSRRIAEAVDARLAVRYTSRGALVFEAESSLAGLEVAGDVNAM
jgi:tocopherol cyclase